MTNRNGLTQEDRQNVSDLIRQKPKVLFEVIRREGDEELKRPFSALWWSGIAAGLAIGLSPLCMAFIAVALDGVSWKPFIMPLGYTVGFVLVILARQQLFTENTITTVLPLMAETTIGNFLLSARVWSIVLAANFVGAFFFAAFIEWGDFLPEAARTAVLEISHHAVERSFSAHLTGGILAGWLIAALVWVLPAAESAEFPVIVFFTYVIGLTHSSHIVAGSVEAFLLILDGQIGAAHAIFSFGVPALLGNIIGGTALFALISYAQVREEIEPE